MPERIGSVELAPMPLATTVSAFMSEDWLTVNFIFRPFYLYVFIYLKNSSNNKRC